MRSHLNPVARPARGGLGVLPLLAVSLAGCDAPADRPGSAVAFQLDTVASGVVIARNAPEDPDAPPEGWRVQEQFRAGTTDGGDSPGFGEVAGVEVGADGTVFVLDRQADLVYRLDSNGRYQRLASDGRPAGTYRRSLGSGARELLAGPDGRILEMSVFGEPGGGPVRAHEARAILLERDPRDDATMVVSDTTWAPPPRPVPSWEIEPVEVRPGMAYAGVEAVPFTPRSRACADPGGGLWVGETDEMRFLRISSDGDTLRIVERTGAEASPVAPEDVDQAIEEIVGHFGDESRDAMRDALDADLAQVPTEMPRWSHCFVDPEARLWVKRFRSPRAPADEPAEWEVYDPVGRYLGRLDLPLGGSPAPRFRGGLLVGVGEDGLGVPHVAVLEVSIGAESRPGSSSTCPVGCGPGGRPERRAGATRPGR